MITIYDPNLKTFRFNRALRETLGWTEEDASSGDLMALCYPDPGTGRWSAGSCSRWNRDGGTLC